MNQSGCMRATKCNYIKREKEPSNIIWSIITSPLWVFKKYIKSRWSLNIWIIWNHYQGMEIYIPSQCGGEVSRPAQRWTIFQGKWYKLTNITFQRVRWVHLIINRNRKSRLVPETSWKFQDSLLFFQHPGSWVWCKR